MDAPLLGRLQARAAASFAFAPTGGGANPGGNWTGLSAQFQFPFGRNSHPVCGGILRSRLVLGYALRMPPLIRSATADDTARIGAIARSAYAKYVPRMGRQPLPMVADYAGLIAAGHVVVIETAGAVDGYMVAWPETDAYFVDNIGVDPARQGKGLGRKLMAHAAREAKRRHLPAIRLYTNPAMTENLSMYVHMGFVETHRVVEKGIDRVYMRWNLAAGDE
jgi:ribosomal protein S18 acetylase RimI-like enzyme